MLNYYGLFDRVSKTYLDLDFDSNAGAYVRKRLPSFVRVVPFKDMELHEVGTIDNSKELPEFNFLKTPKVLSWEVYKFPETTTKEIEGKTVQELHNESVNAIRKDPNTTISVDK